MTTVLISVCSSLSTALIFWSISQLNKHRKGSRIARKVDVVTLRNSMIRICRECELREYRTEWDNKVFYEMYEIYTKDLKQNSYICKEVEPAFNKINNNDKE